MILLFAVGLALAALVWWWVARPVERPTREQLRGRPSSPAQVETEETPPRPERARESAEEVPADPVAQPAEPAGTLALVVDDLGRSLEELEALEALGVPISWAVLPFESRTEEVVSWLGARNLEVLCHLPMEASNGANPGPGALTSAMSPRQLAAATRQALQRVPIAVGVNNHMGSEVTGNREAMAAVLQIVENRELFFVDSRTSPDTVGYDMARSRGIPAAERDVFLDADASVEGVREQFDRWLRVAREQGAAVAIAHPRPATLEVLRERIPRAKEEGFVFVPVSFLLERTAPPEP